MPGVQDGISIAGVQVAGRLWLAPLAGYTDLPYRIVAAEHGCPFSFTEMVSAKGLIYGGKTKELLAHDAREGAYGVQLFGRDPGILAEAARRLYESGQAGQMLNLNMGCPMPKIVNNGEGSALLKDLALCGRIIEAMAKAVPIPVTVKVRRGYEEGEEVCVELARIAQESGAAAYFLHGRTRAQMYAGRADWGCIARAKAAVRIPVFGNGDVQSLEEAQRRMDETGCDGVLIGRGAVGNPFAFCAQTPTPQQRYAAAQRHVELALTQLPERAAVLRLRKQMGNYLHGCRGGAQLRVRIHQAQTAQELLAPIRTALLGEWEKEEGSTMH